MSPRALPAASIPRPLLTNNVRSGSFMLTKTELVGVTLPLPVIPLGEIAGCWQIIITGNEEFSDDFKMKNIYVQKFMQGSRIVVS